MIFNPKLIYSMTYKNNNLILKIQVLAQSARQQIVSHSNILIEQLTRFSRRVLALRLFYKQKSSSVTYKWCSAVAGQNAFFGGGGNLAEQNLGGLGEKHWKTFEIFIPEIVANASNFRNYIIYIYIYSWGTRLLRLLYLHNYWEMGGGAV